jgi:hypothetical protein
MMALGLPTKLFKEIRQVSISVIVDSRASVLMDVCDRNELRKTRWRSNSFKRLDFKSAREVTSPISKIRLIAVK